MQKDYWNVARRDFRALGFIVVIFLLITLYALSVSGTNGPVGTRLIISGTILLVIAVCYFMTANLFKKRSTKAIPVAYSILGVLLVANLANNIIAGTLISLSMLIGILIPVYLLTVVYKASKQKVS